MLRRTKANYFRNLNPKDSKQFWKAVKYLKKQQCTFPRFKQGGLTTNTDLQKAECLNSSCFNNFHLPLTQSHSHSSSETPCLPMFCTVTEVEQFLQDLEVSKASGSDKISPAVCWRWLQQILPYLLPSYSIFLSIWVRFKTSGKNLWLFQLHVLIPKCNKLSDPGNYRLISLTRILCKTLGKAHDVQSFSQRTTINSLTHNGVFILVDQPCVHFCQ